MRTPRTILASLGFGALCAPAFASFHLIQINEVFSNADGSIQYVELIARANNQTNLGPTRIVARDAANETETVLFDFVANYAWSNGQTLLVATPGFEAAAGFAPDFVMPANSLIFTPDGRVLFRRDTTAAVDSVAFGDFTGNNGTFGNPAPALPLDGVHSLTRINTSTDNEIAWAVMVNSPRRTDGTTTTLNPDPGPNCPGDLNGDGVIDFDDLGIVLSGFGTDYNFDDLGMVLGAFCTDCLPPAS